MVLCAVAGIFWLPSIPVSMLIMIPMVIDGFLQLKTRYESTNPRRFVTGFFFGWGLMALLLLSTAAAFRFGYGLTA